MAGVDCELLRKLDDIVPLLLPQLPLLLMRSDIILFRLELLLSPPRSNSREDELTMVQLLCRVLISLPSWDVDAYGCCVLCRMFA